MNGYPEFLNGAHTFSVPYGMYEALLTEKIEPPDQINQIHNFIFRRRVDLSGVVIPQPIFFQLPSYYGYHLNGIRGFYPRTAQDAESPQMFVQLFQTNRNRELYNEPLPLRLVATPAEQQNVYYYVKCNNTFAPDSLIEIRVSGQNGTDPSYIEIVTDGYRIPRSFYTDAEM
jgi:hypothetical protein